MDEPLLSDANRSFLPSFLPLLRERLARIDDHRQAGTIKHQQVDVLGCALCAMVCGFGDFCAMATFARYRLGWLRHFLPLANGAPSHDTFRNVFMAVDADRLTAVLCEWCSVLAGKCLVHLLRTWVDDMSLSVGRGGVRPQAQRDRGDPALVRLPAASGSDRHHRRGRLPECHRRTDRRGGRTLHPRAVCPACATWRCTCCANIPTKARYPTNASALCSMRTSELKLLLISMRKPSHSRIISGSASPQ